MMRVLGSVISNFLHERHASGLMRPIPALQTEISARRRQLKQFVTKNRLLLTACLHRRSSMMNVEIGLALTDVTSAFALDYHGKPRRQQGVPIWNLLCTDGR